VSNSIQWWKPGHVLDEARCTWADWWDALFGRRETFVRIEVDGSWCICEPHDVPDMRDGAEGDATYIVTEVRMTRRQFERLPEFEGW